MNNGSEGSYGSYTVSIQDFAMDRKAGMKRAVVFAEEGMKDEPYEK